MFRLYKKFSARDWIGLILIIGLTILQVYFTMTLVDYIKYIIQSISYLNYHNHPELLGLEISSLLERFGNWNGLIANLDVFPLSEEMKETILSIANATTGDIWKNGGMMLLLAGGTMVVQMMISALASVVAADLSTNIRSAVYNKVENFSLAEINQFSTPSLITRTTNDIQQVQMANLMMMRMIFAAPVTAIWTILKIKASSTELTIATAIAIVLLIITIMTIMLVTMPKFKIMQKLTDEINSVTRENLTGIRIVRAYNAEEYQEKKFENANQNFTKAHIFTGKMMALMSPMMMIIMNGISLAIYWIGSHLINDGKINYATVTSFMMLSSQVIMAFVMLMMMFVLWPRASVSAQRINEIIQTKSSILDPKVEKTFTLEGCLEFKNVSFTYPDGDEKALSNITFKVEKGKTIAFIGATGSGKTTLVNLIPRLYDVTEGEILVNGVNVKDVKQETLRNVIGYVPQKGFLFKDTVKANIAFSSKHITDNDVIEAAKIAEADTFISKMENGYDSLIAQGGKNVSGGQKQRLCIARAIAMHPQIYVFDDSFSALDYKTDKKVRENLKQIDKNSTKVIVAQRIGTIMDADQIIVLENGKMAGIGTHDELLQNCKVYQEIALSQLSKEELGL